VIHKDIRFVTEEDMLGAIPKGTHIDVITSGMPCETFSTAGSKSRSFYDHRQFLFMEPIRLAKIVSSKSIIFENVPAILTKTVSKDSSVKIVDVLKEELIKSGYKFIKEQVLKAVDYGVPQKRERYFLFATRDESLWASFDFPLPSTKKPVTVGEALDGLPHVDANDSQEVFSYPENKDVSAYSKLMKSKTFWKLDNYSNMVTYHKGPNHRPGSIERFKLIGPGEGLKDLFDKLTPAKIARLQEKKILPKKWYIQRNRRLVDSSPSVTVTSHCLDELIHPHLNRSMTVREVARLQSFPDHYIFAGGPYICPHIYETQDKYEQIGDAVPPLMAYYIGNAYIQASKDAYESKTILRTNLQRVVPETSGVSP
jgi:DNA (cytosine-5)-methyltransferase 1